MKWDKRPECGHESFEYDCMDCVDEGKKQEPPRDDTLSKAYAEIGRIGTGAPSYEFQDITQDGWDGSQSIAGAKS